jgi:hypothetical protein
MFKLNLNKAASEFEMIDDNTHLFYNTQTGEFGYYNKSTKTESRDKFDGDEWIAAPNSCSLKEYETMKDFAKTIDDIRIFSLICDALWGSGVFRRFKITLLDVRLYDEWSAFRHKSLVSIAREWCIKNGIGYIDTE